VLRDRVSKTSLLVGVPVAYAEFLSRVSGSDWLSKFNDPGLGEKKRRESLFARWQSEYSVHVAEPLQDLIQTASELGMIVRTGATLESIREVTDACRVVVLYAHWKGPEIVGDDFVAPIDVRQFARRAAADQTPLGAWLRPRLTHLCVDGNVSHMIRRSIWDWFTSKSPSPSIRDVLSDAMSRAADDDWSTSDGVDCVLESEVTSLARRRDELDHLFRDLLRPGNRLELFDGLHSKEEVDSALSQSFDGVLDLTTCTSTVLADFLGRQRYQRVRTVQFPAVQEPRWAARCLQLTLRLFAEQDVPYQEARALATAMMERAVAERSAAMQ
jgi:hypothetical protein